MKALVGILLIAGSLLPFQTRRTRATGSDDAAGLLDFRLTETLDDIRKAIGEPAQTNDLGSAYELWDYKLSTADTLEFSHTFCFAKAPGTLASVTRKWGRERNVEALFPAAESKPYYFPSPEQPQIGLRARMLTGDRVLLAMSAPKPGDQASQLILVRRDAVKTFFPWLDRLLPAKGPEAAAEPRPGAKKSRSKAR